MYDSEGAIFLMPRLPALYKDARTGSEQQCAEVKFIILVLEMDDFAREEVELVMSVSLI